jgi:hypothetical protein
MRRFVYSAAIASLVAATLGWVGTGTAHAAAGDGPFFFEPPTRVLDTRLFPPKKAEPNAQVSIGGGFFNVAVAEPETAGIVSLGPCGGTADTVVLSFGPGDERANRVWAPDGSCLTPSVRTHLVVDKVGHEGAPAAGGDRYFPLTDPVNVLTIGSVQAALPPVSTSGAGLPPDATGVAIRIEIAATTAGYMVAHDCDQPSVGLADVVTATGDPAENIAYVQLDASGAFCLVATVDLSIGVEVLGYFTDALTSGGERPPTLVYSNVPAPGLTPITPTRVLDTRTGLGAPQGKLAGGQVLDLDLTPYIVPETSAVVMNLTATEAEGSGFLTAYPCDEDQPDASNLNFVAGANVPNLATVKVSADGHVCIFAFAATHVLADLAGTFDFDGGDLYGAVAPARILDTRTGGTRLDAGQVQHLQVTGQGGVPAGATAVTLNLTATEADGPGYLTAFPCDEPRPTASNVNYVAGQNVPNLVTVKLAADGSVCIFAFAATHVIADVAGYYGASGDAGLVAISPTRLLDTRDDPGDPIEGGFEFVLDVTGGDPGTIKAVTLNLTVTEPEGPGYITAFPCDEPRPNASNVNFKAGQDVANLATVKVAADGTVCIYAFATTHVIADLAGFMDAGGFWVPDFRVD